MLIGPSFAGKSTLARQLAGLPSKGLTSSTPQTQPYERRSGGVPGATILDIPGADGLKAWNDTISKIKPHLVCFLVDFGRLTGNDAYFELSERQAQHVREMVSRGHRALVLTHTDCTNSEAPLAAASNNRAILIRRRLETELVTAGSLVHQAEADNVVHDVLSWTT